MSEIDTIIVPEEAPDPHPYPQWSPGEEATLKRWYATVGLKQCSDLWPRLTGRDRSIAQIDNKARRLGIQDDIPNDWFELFE